MSTRRYLTLSLLLFTALTAVMTFPQVLHMRDAVHDDGDPLLNAWTLSWVAHQLPRVPAHLFDANIFYPERRTLAFSETLLLPAVCAAPLHWLGAGPILVHNIVFFSGFIVSGAGMALLARLLTGDAGAGVLAGLVFAFLPYRIDHYPHLQLQQTQCLPFAMWAFHRLLRTGRLRDGVLLGLFTAGQILSCIYYGLMLVPYLAVVCGTMLLARVGRAKTTSPNEPEADGIPLNAALIGVLVAVVITVVAIVPLGRAYLGARSVVGERGRAEVESGSATWRNYLGPPSVNAMYGKAFERFTAPERRLFPGFVAVALACVALWPRTRDRTNPRSVSEKSGHAPSRPAAPAKNGRNAQGYLARSALLGARQALLRRAPGRRAVAPSGFRDDPRWAYALGLLVAFDISLGLNGLSYGLLYDYVLPFRALRIPARMGLIVGFSLAVLAGYGVARVARRMPSRRLRQATLLVVGGLILAEYVSRPIPLQPIPLSAPNVYAEMLRDRGEGPDAVIVEYPVSGGDNPTYMYYSTFHWQRLVNGYSGFFPPSYGEFVDAFRGFPDDQSIDALATRGVRYVLVHQERMIGTRYQRLIPQLDRRSDLALVSRGPGERYGQHGEISLYRVLYRNTP